MLAKAIAANESGNSFVEVVTSKENEIGNNGEIEDEVKQLQKKADSNDNQESKAAIQAAINYLKTNESKEKSETEGAQGPI
jgi:hypothetical protein